MIRAGQTVRVTRPLSPTLSFVGSVGEVVDVADGLVTMRTPDGTWLTLPVESVGLVPEWVRRGSARVHAPTESELRALWGDR